MDDDDGNHTTTNNNKRCDIEQCFRFVRIFSFSLSLLLNFDLSSYSVATNSTETQCPLSSTRNDIEMDSSIFGGGDDDDVEAIKKS